MADLSKTVEIIFGAKDNVTVTVKNLERDLKDFDATVQSVAAPLADVANKVLAMETAVLALSAAFVGSAIDAAGKFGTQISEIGTLFGGNTEQINAFGKTVQDYGAISTQSLESINGAIYNAVSAGVEYGDSVQFVADAEKLAVAGRGDLNETTKVLVSTLNAYGASTDEAAKYSDTLFTIVKQGQTTLPELSQSLSQVTSLASAGGVPFETLGAAIAALTANGVPTSEAMTKIRGAIETLIDPSSAAAKAAQEWGVSLDATSIKSKGFETVLKELYTASGGSADQLGKVFTTTESLQAALILGADSSGKFAASMQAMADKTGATQQAFETMASSYEYSMQRMSNAADVALIKAGQPLLDEFGSVANGISKVFQSLGSSIDSGAFDPIIQALETFGASASDTLANIAQNLPDALAALDFGPLLDSLGNLGDSVGDAFADIFGNIDLDTPEGLASALQTIVNGIAALTNVTSGIIDSFSPIFTAFGDLAKEAGNAGEESQLAAGQFLGVAQQIMAFGTGLTAALTLFAETGTSITSVIDVFAGGVRIAFNGVQVAIDGVGAIILTTLKTIADGFALVLPGDIGERWAEKSAQFSGLLDDLAERTAINTGDMAEGWDQVQRGLDGVGGKMETTAGSAENLATSTDVATTSGKEFTAIDWAQSATGIDYVGVAAERLGISLESVGEGADSFGQYVKSAADEADIARAKTNGYRLEIDELGNRTFIPVIENTKKTAAATKDAAKEMEEAAKKAVDYDLKLQEIQSKERIAYIEAKFKFDQAQIEADTQRLVAAFESIGTSITSTGETLTGLIGTWAGMADTFEGAKLWDLIQNEEKRRQEAFEQQKILLAEQIKYMQARTTAMLKGDTLLKVEAAGLTPHLERIFHEILRACQVKANEQGLELLLGAV